MTLATIDFVRQHPDCFERSQLRGHITGSAWVVSPDRRFILLIHHRKLDRWLQPGGHADGDPDVAAVALREAREETGLTSLKFFGVPGVLPPIFDVDVHPIPARGDVHEHLHYDIRFLIEADLNEAFGSSDEIKNIRWQSVKTVESMFNSESILRMIRKNIEN